MPQPSISDLQSLFDPLTLIARQAGAAIMEVHEQGATALEKQDGSPVTEADQKAETIILDGLSKCAPGITIISEENPDSHTSEVDGPFFLVDPLDGTKEFIKQDCVGSFTVNIALIDRGEPVLGVVYAPALQRMFWGANGIGAFEDGKEIKVRASARSDALALVSVSHMEPQTEDWLAEYNICSTWAIGSSLKFCLLAAGEADVYPRFGPTMEWDTAAGDAILRAAGGNMRSIPDNDFKYGKQGFRNGPFLASGKWKE